VDLTKLYRLTAFGPLVGTV